MRHRQVKDRLFAIWAHVARALASPKRVELLDLLAQGERTVEQLAREAGLTVTNTSSHLGVLKAARLVEARKAAQFVFHRLSDDSVVRLLREIQAVARARLHEVGHIASTHLDGRDAFPPLTAAELRRRLKVGDVTVIDVRPPLEYEAGHIEGALSVPIESLESRLVDLPTDRTVVAYCRGPYCVFAVEAVERLRMRGYDARRLADGLPDWRVAGRPVAVGAEVVTGRAVGGARTSRQPRHRPARRASRG